MTPNQENEQILLEEEREVLSEFTKKGGRILETKENGVPKHWLCGVSEQGKLIDPPGIDPKNVLHEINNEGKYEGVNPSPKDIEEIKEWRNDWDNPDPKGKN